MAEPLLLFTNISPIPETISCDLAPPAVVLGLDNKTGSVLEWTEKEEPGPQVGCSLPLPTPPDPTRVALLLRRGSPERGATRERDTSRCRRAVRRAQAVAEHQHLFTNISPTSETISCDMPPPADAPGGAPDADESGGAGRATNEDPRAVEAEAAANAQKKAARPAVTTIAPAGGGLENEHLDGNCTGSLGALGASAWCLALVCLFAPSPLV